MPFGFPSFFFFSLPVPTVSGGLSTNKAATGVYNSSTTPAELPWNTYNYCNAPHVNAEHYFKPSSNESAKILYLNVVTRHHKVCFCTLGVYFDPG